MRRLKLFSLLFLGIGLTNLQAQNMMNVKEKAGTHTSYTLSSMAKVTFSDGNMIIFNSGAGTETFDLNHIRYVSFIDLITEIPKPEKQVESNFTLYPNPAADHLQIRLGTMENCNVQVDIIDTQGRIVLQQKICIKDANSTAILNLQQLAKGLYICRVQSGEGIETIKFIKNQ